MLHRGKALADLGVWLSHNGRAADGAPMLAEAGAVFDRLGAVAWRAQLNQRLVTVG